MKAADVMVTRVITVGRDTTVQEIVRDGIVELWGDAGSQDEKHAIRVAAETVPGVRKVEDYIAINAGYHGV